MHVSGARREFRPMEASVENQGKGGAEKSGSVLPSLTNSEGNLKFTLFKVLNALKHFYSFKELEERLGVSAQILWRYVSLRSVPERVTAERLLQRIEDEKLIDEAFERAIKDSEEPWQVLSSPGIMELAELKVISTLKGDRVNVVITGPDGYSTAFGAILADALHARLCVASRSPHSRHLIVKSYKVSQDYYDTLIFPRECIQRRGRALLVSVDGDKASQISALIDVANMRQVSIAGVLAIFGSESKIRDLVKSKTGSDAKVLVLAKYCEGQEDLCSEVKKGRQES
jgi:hypothetical protein